MPVSEAEFRRIALEDPDGFWELHCGQLRHKPVMSVGHSQVTHLLFGMLYSQLDRTRYAIRLGHGHLQRATVSFYIPDLFVIPMDVLGPMLERPRELEVYAGPVPLVVEVWSPSTGTYDIDSKLPEYQRRGDLEIWRIHPFERTLRTWRRQPDGSYAESEHTTGSIQPVALPGVTVDIDALFRW